MNGNSLFLKCSKGEDARVHDQCTVPGEQFVPGFKLGFIPTDFRQRLQKGIALSESFGISRKMSGIPGLHLRENFIEILAPVSRSAFNHPGHLGQKGNSVELTIDIRNAFFHAIQQHLLRKAWVGRIGCGILYQADLNGVPPSLTDKFSQDTRNHDGFNWSIKVHQLAVTGSRKGGKVSQVTDGFKYGGFSLRILPCEQNHPPGEVQFQAGENAVVRQRQPGEVH